MRKKSTWETLQHRAKARINAEQKKLDVLKIDAPGVEDAQANGKHEYNNKTLRNFVNPGWCRSYW
jgi:hypothetical protein